jgi:hypothetical protein
MNPFTLKIVKNEQDFCDRTGELAKLASFVDNKTNMILFAPRRFGKTSLVKRLHTLLTPKKYLPIYIDLYGVSSLEDVSSRTAKAVYSALDQKSTLFKKAVAAFKSFRPVMRPTETGISISVEHTTPSITGIDLLSRTMEDLGGFIEQTALTVNVVFDEFQEIAELQESQTEGVLRKYIQEHECSYFFLGSRRGILLQMFNDKKRPFFQSGFTFELKELPLEDLSGFIKGRFEDSGKTCDLELARKIAGISHQHPYYSQKLAYYIFEISGTTAQEDDLSQGLEEMVTGEQALFEAMLQGLSPQQIALLRAIAKNPSGSLMSADYMKVNNLKSIGGVQGAIKKLTELDLIEKKEAVWQVVDPFFSSWLAR